MNCPDECSCHTWGVTTEEFEEAVSYTVFDLLRDYGVDLEQTTIDHLVIRLAEHYAARNSDFVYDIAEEFLRDHNADGEDVPEYVKGVYQGMLIAARKLREE